MGILEDLQYLSAILSSQLPDTTAFSDEIGGSIHEGEFSLFLINLLSTFGRSAQFGERVFLK